MRVVQLRNTGSSPSSFALGDDRPPFDLAPGELRLEVLTEYESECLDSLLQHPALVDALDLVVTEVTAES